MEIGFAVLADYALMDLGGKLSIMGIFQRVLVPSLPIAHPRMYLCLGLRFGAADSGSTHQLGFTLKDPEGKQVVGQADLSFTVSPAEHSALPGVNATLELVGVEFRTAGLYSVEIVIDGERRATIPLEVAQVPIRAVL